MALCVKAASINCRAAVQHRPAARAGPVRVVASLREDALKAMKVVGVSAASLAMAASVHAANVNMGTDTGNLVFDPQDISIKAGDSITWTVVGTPPHNVVFDADDNEGLDVSGLSHEEFLNSKGAEVSSTFKNPGKFNYKCEPHESSMYGTVTVS